MICNWLMTPADIRDRLSFKMEHAFIHAFNRHNLKYKPAEPAEMIDRSRAEMAVHSHLVIVCGDQDTARVIFELSPDEGLDFSPTWPPRRWRAKSRRS